MNRIFKMRLKRRLNNLDKNKIYKRNIFYIDVDKHIRERMLKLNEVSELVIELCHLFKDLGTVYEYMLLGKFPTLNYKEFILTDRKKTFKEEIVTVYKGSQRMENILNMIEMWRD